MCAYERGTVSDDGSTLSESHPLVVGVDLGGTQIRAAVLRGPTFLSRIGLLTGEHPSPDRLIPRLFQAVRQALDGVQITLDQIAGIGIGATGPLNPWTGVVFAPPTLPGWNQVPLKDLFHERFGVPIFVENDANAAALAEYLFGAGRGWKELVYMTVSTGIGGGILTDGKLLEGNSGTAAELGHMTIDWQGERCICGNVGCLEQLASGTAIACAAQEAIARGQGQAFIAFALSHHSEDGMTSPSGDKAPDPVSPPQITARTVAQAAEAGIPLACAIMSKAAEALGVGLVNIIHLFNPQLIILGSGVVQIGELLLEPARRIVQARTMQAPLHTVQIIPAALGGKRRACRGRCPCVLSQAGRHVIILTVFSERAKGHRGEIGIYAQRHLVCGLAGGALK